MEICEQSVAIQRGEATSPDGLHELFAKRATSVEITPIFTADVRCHFASAGVQGKRIEVSGWENARVRGGVSGDYQALGCFVSSKPPNSFMGKLVESGSLAWSSPAKERDAIYRQSIEGVYLFIDVNQFECLLEQRGFSQKKSFSQVELHTLPPTLAQLLIASSNQTKSVLDQWTAGTVSQHVFDHVFDQLLDIFLDCAALALDDNYAARDMPLGPKAIVTRVEELLVEHPDKLFTVHQICDRLRISRRTLQYAFADVLGVAPRTYLRNWRLARVRDDLRSGKFPNVTSAATNWSFFELGRFSAYYHALFGEYPSETHL